jgi:hypothetical protein
VKTPDENAPHTTLRVPANPRSRSGAAKHAPHARRTPFVLLILGLLIGGMGLLLALNTASAANEVSRHDLAANDQSAAAQLVELENEVQASAAPANLAAAAAALGMVPAGNPGFLEIGTTGRVRVLGRAAAASPLPVVIPHPAPTSTAAAPKRAKQGDRSATKKTAKKTAQKSAKKSAGRSAKKTAKNDTHRAKANHTANPLGRPTATSPKSSPTPTATPTPETTLPGGNR